MSSAIGEGDFDHLQSHHHLDGTMQAAVPTLEMQRKLLAKTKTDKTNILLKKSKYKNIKAKSLTVLFCRCLR
jgi:hypothetical protein